jgi:PadR family transcriptional regulator PadR
MEVHQRKAWVTAVNAQVDDWEKRWRKGVLPFAVLGALKSGPRHGYALAVAVKDVLGASIPEGTLYPLLAGFEQEGLTTAEWIIQDSGPAKKTYSITAKGMAALAEGARRWIKFDASLRGLLDG